MVESQIADRGVRDRRVLDAMRSVQRHLFVPEAIRNASYDDNALGIGHSQTISQPYIVALMTEALELKGGERVLEIGTGSGYQTAVLASLCDRVYTVERIGRLSRRAQETLKNLGVKNVEYLVGDGSLGWQSEAPFDAVIVTAAPPRPPEPLKSQLAIGGRLVVPAGDRGSQELLRIRRTGDNEFATENLLAVVFVPLIGEHGWKGGGEEEAYV